MPHFVAPLLRRIASCTVSFAVLACVLLPRGSARADRVEVVRSGTGWQLTIDGEPFQVRGAGGHQYLDLLKQSGGNAIRTWGVDETTGELLDRAHDAGLRVLVGIWLGHERHGFDYTDDQAVARQLEHVRESVERHKDHPALLAWGLGNEMEGEAGDNAAIWSHIEAAAALTKRLDPDHPTVTVVAELGAQGRKLRNIHRLCPSIDIVGVNSYGGAFSLPERYREFGGTKPYLVTEFGPLGPWEVGRNNWGAAVEVPSTGKGDFYRRAYETFTPDPACLGSFAFLWGSKQEATTTWFGMFLPGGEKLEPVDVMTELWSGRRPENLCPRIESIAVEGTPEVEAGGRIRVSLRAADPEGDALRVRWQLKLDPMEYATGGDAQDVPPAFPEAIADADVSGATLTMPADGGKYRVFAYVYDEHGAAATANLPLHVQGPAQRVTAAESRLPMTLAGEGPVPPGGFVPSGYMGNLDAVTMEEAHDRGVKEGRSCWRISYSQPTGWAGVVWQHPANDWGEVDGGFDLTEARHLSFWARGERGGEQVKFGFGLLGRDKAFYDTDRAEMEVTLTDEWKRYRIEVAEKDLSRIKTGFYWVLAAQGRPVTFYLDSVRYE